MIGTKTVEEIGFSDAANRLAQLDRLSVVVLDGFRVCRPTAEADLQAELAEIPTVCPNIRELNLSRNLWREWTDIVRVCDQLSRLETLTVE